MIATTLVLLSALSAAPPDLQLERTVRAPVAEVWKAWTTLEGARTFFAPDAKIEPKAGGAYELYFMPEAPAGQKGCDGCTVIAVEPAKKLAFTWNFPPVIPSLRESKATTQVTIELAAAGARQTRVKLTQTGWKEGADWEKGRAYFERAWATVLARLDRRFRRGPIDWKHGWRPESPEALAFLQGSWRIEEAGKVTEEHWSAAPQGLVAMTRELQGGKPVFFELVTVEREGDEVVYSMRMFQPGLKAVPRTEKTPIRLLLEGVEGQDATFVSESGPAVRLRYQRKGDLLEATLDHDGKTDRFAYKKTSL